MPLLSAPPPVHLPTATRRHWLPAFLLPLLAPVAPVVRAQPPAAPGGHAFEGRARVGGSDLVLNGSGVRAVAWFKGYSAALYLPRRAATAAQACAMPGAKRLQIVMLQSVPAGEFVKAVRQGIARNTRQSALPALAERLQRFEQAIAATQAVKKGDVVDLDFEPGRGMTFTMNGTPRGEVIAGEDFYAALLRSFVGERPYDVDLRAGLLGGTAASAAGRP